MAHGGAAGAQTGRGVQAGAGGHRHRGEQSEIGWEPRPRAHTANRTRRVACPLTITRQKKRQHTLYRNIEDAMARLLSFCVVSRAGDADAYEVARLAQATRRLGTAWGNLRTGEQRRAR